jgi:diguanylate cyclase (GGDEF)-like protein
MMTSISFSAERAVAENAAIADVSTAEAISEFRSAIADFSPSEGGKGALELLAALERRFDAWSIASHSEARDLRARLEHSSRLAATDEITGLANRRSFDERMRAAWEDAGKAGAPVGLLLVDIDQFKNLNDTYGHSVGDACLRKVAATIHNAIDRPVDIACRYGGDEFAVILPDTDEWGARRLADSIRRNVSACEFTERRTKVTNTVTVSIGAASSPPVRERLPNILIAAADHALYRAKQHGRNRVELASEDNSVRPSSPAAGTPRVEKVSYKEADGHVVFGPDTVDVTAESKRFTGIILLVRDGKVVQRISRGVAAIHDATRLSEVPAARDMVCIMYRAGHGKVVQLILSRGPQQVQEP